MAFMLDNDSAFFPDTGLADEDGLLAVGGDLSVDRLLAAYRLGIFPWYSEGLPVLWWSPDPRFVLFPEKLHVSASMRRVLKKNSFEITFDSAFSEVLDACRKERRKEKGTWITDAVVEGYTGLHREGYAHSVEAWTKDGELAGGLYGVSLGRVFFGESMFSLKPNASKAAFIRLVEKLKDGNFSLIDCQVYTSHLESLGAEMISRSEFQKILSESLRSDPFPSPWR
jgi:leucyl/phenylalanyl-tRNA--protein transferase